MANKNYHPTLVTYNIHVTKDEIMTLKINDESRG
jgi:hypothetical protein